MNTKSSDKDEAEKRKSKAVILDRDGTLNVDEKEYTHRVEDFELYDGVIEGLKELRDFKLFIVTNQPGIGRGYYKEEDMHKFNDHMLKEFLKYGIKIEKVYFCPHTPEDNCDCRKPSAKFIKEAERDFGLDLSRSWVIGDHGYDVGMGINAGCRTIYLLTGHGRKHLSELRVKPDYIASTFLEGVMYITKNEKG
jgi:histidinol-phosphate phosphatase family protein